MIMLHNVLATLTFISNVWDDGSQVCHIHGLALLQTPRPDCAVASIPNIILLLLLLLQLMH
jgi:hypothetical protein